MNKNLLIIGILLVGILTFGVMAENGVFDNTDYNGYNITNINRVYADSFYYNNGTQFVGSATVTSLNRSQVINNWADCPIGSAQIGENETGRYCDANIVNTTDITNANTSMKTYVDTKDASLQTNITNANTSMKSYVDTYALLKAGGTMSGALVMGGQNLTMNTGVYSYANTSCLFFVTPTMNMTIGC